MLMKEKALILFFKSPEKGVVKTRLAKALGDEFTLELYQCFIADILNTGNKIDADIFILYSITDETRNKDFFWRKEYTCFPQRGTDLGIRMYNAFQEIGTRGYRKLTLIGSDTPDLPAIYIDEAFYRLDGYDLVLGPSVDGGYFLIALRQDTINEAVFNNIPWSTSKVLRETEKVIRQKEMTCHLLPQWDDIDDIDDLRHFYNHHKRKGETSRTMAFLSRNREILDKRL